MVNLSGLFSLADTLKEGKGGGKKYTQPNMIIYEWEIEPYLSHTTQQQQNVIPIHKNTQTPNIKRRGT